jgi:hypothetical protein
MPSASSAPAALTSDHCSSIEAPGATDRPVIVLDTVTRLAGRLPSKALTVAPP